MLQLEEMGQEFIKRDMPASAPQPHGSAHFSASINTHLKLRVCLNLNIIRPNKSSIAMMQIESAEEFIGFATIILLINHVQAEKSFKFKHTPRADAS